MSLALRVFIEHIRKQKKSKKRHLCVLSAHAHHNVAVQRTRNTHLGEGGALSLAPFLNRPPHVRVAMAAFDRRFAFLVAERIGRGRTERRGAAPLAHGTDARRLSFSIRSDRLFPQCICVGGHKIVLIIVAHTSKVVARDRAGRQGRDESPRGN